jgi:hypothetical protein
VKDSLAFAASSGAEISLQGTHGRRALARLGRALDLARLFDLPDNHPDRMIAASIVLYVGLGIIIAITVRSHLEAAHP